MHFQSARSRLFSVAEMRQSDTKYGGVSSRQFTLFKPCSETMCNKQEPYNDALNLFFSSTTYAMVILISVMKGLYKPIKPFVIVYVSAHECPAVVDDWPACLCLGHLGAPIEG